MKEDDHERAQKLIAAGHIEGLAAIRQQTDWLESHLEACPECAARAQATERALHSLRVAAVPINPSLVTSTQQRVRLRARELREHQARMRALWLSCALSWLLGVLTAPLVWRGFQWAGQHLALSKVVWVAAFALWWVTPAAVVGAVLAGRLLRPSGGSRDVVTLPR
jgi:anti-sigma factor RsiW